MQIACTAPTARIRNIQLRAELQSALATPWSTAAPASDGTATRATAQSNPARMPRYIIVRCTRIASRMSRQPGFRFARASFTNPPEGANRGARVDRRMQ